MVLESMSSNREVGPYYEPGVELLVPGTRVRIHVSPECEFKCPNGCDWHHGGAHDGMVGVLSRLASETTDRKCTLPTEPCGARWTPEEMPMHGHRFAVYIREEPLPLSGWFAAIELEVQDG